MAPCRTAYMPEMHTCNVDLALNHLALCTVIHIIH